MFNFQEFCLEMVKQDLQSYITSYHLDKPLAVLTLVCVNVHKCTHTRLPEIR